MKRRSRLGVILRLARRGERGALIEYAARRLSTRKAETRLTVTRADANSALSEAMPEPGRLAQAADLRRSVERAILLTLRAPELALGLAERRGEEELARTALVAARLRVRAIDTAIERRASRERATRRRRERRRLDERVLALRQLRRSLGIVLIAGLPGFLTPLSLHAEASQTPSEPQAGAPDEITLMDPGAVAREALEIEARNQALRLLEDDLRAELEELKQLREQITSHGNPTAGPQPDLGRLVKFYQAMKPKTAATLLEALPLKLAGDVLASMSPRSAGKILNSIGSERAVQISERMAGRR